MDVVVNYCITLYFIFWLYLQNIWYKIKSKSKNNNVQTNYAYIFKTKKVTTLDLHREMSSNNICSCLKIIYQSFCKHYP